MLTENQVLLLSEPVEKMYADASAQLLINIAKHLGEGEINDLEAWQIERLTEISKLSEENAEIIAANTRDKGSEIQDSVEKAVESTVEDVDKECRQLSIVEKGIVAAVVINLANRARQDTTRVDATMLQSSIDEYRTAISDVVQYYRSAELKRILRDTSKLSAGTEGARGIIDQAIESNAFYAQTRKEAIQDAIKKLADRGIVGFIDKGGHHWTADAYVAMDIRTTLSNAAIEGQKARAEEYGVYTFQISVKTPARELCAPYQGWICSWNGERGTVYDLNGMPYTLHSIYDTSYGEPAGIFGINCGHRPLTFVDGYSVPQYQPMNAKERKENDEVYKLTQKQRAQEREIRKLKTQAVALDAAGEEIPSNLAYQIKDKTQAYKDFCQQNKLVERLERTRVVGYNRSVSGKATAAAKKHDISIVRSLGAKSKNYDILEPNTGEFFRFVEGTRIQNTQVFSGKGTKHPLHPGVGEGLAEQFGGEPGDWQHVKGHGIIDYYGEERPAEVHWFQEETIGKVKFKVKRWEDEG